MLRRIIAILLTLLLCVPAALADRYAPYEFDMYFIPRWGDGDRVAGVVYSCGEICREEGLCVKLFLQVEGDGNWWPKPTAEQPWAPVEDSFFQIPFVTGGDDIHAVRLALMLVREADAGLLDYDEANAAALCVTTIHRSPDGDISLCHSYRSETAFLPFDLGLDVGFYTLPGMSPGSELSEAHVRSVLKAAAAYTGNVRFYTTTGDIAKAYPIAREMELNVAATAWLDGSDHDREELDALIALCNDGLATTAIVGNETQHGGRLSEAALLEDIAYVRAGITDTGIPVTTADTPDILMNSPAIRDACDALSVNIHPYWNGLSPEDAEQDFRATLEAIIACAGDKPIIVSETGWPTEGGENAGEAGQSTYMDAVYSASWGDYGEQLLQYYWFSLADEPWNQAGDGDAGSHWGLLDCYLNAKQTVYEHYWNWSPDNEFQTELPQAE